jgi:hypothetical protein
VDGLVGAESVAQQAFYGVFLNNMAFSHTMKISSVGIGMGCSKDWSREAANIPDCRDILTINSRGGELFNCQKKLCNFPFLFDG